MAAVVGRRLSEVLGRTLGAEVTGGLAQLAERLPPPALQCWATKACCCLCDARQQKAGIRSSALNVTEGGIGLTLTVGTAA